METTILLRGFVIGLSVAAPVGPMSVFCIRRTLASGRIAGIASGSGVAAADALYASVAALGLTSVTTFMTEHQSAIRIIGGFFLAWIGWRLLRAPAAPSSATAAVPGAATATAFASTFALTLTNPTTILSFAAIFAGFGVATIDGSTSASLLIAGVFAGSMAWWLVLLSVVSMLRSRVTPAWLRRINIISGCVLLGFAGIAVVAGVR